MLKKIIFHPFLFAVFPVLSLYASNSDKVQPFLVVRPLVVVLLAVSVLFFLFRIAMKDWHKAGMMSSISMTIFFMYGHVARDQAVMLLFVSLVLLALLMFIIMSSKKDFRTFTLALHIIAFTLLVFPFARIGAYELSPEPPASSRLMHQGGEVQNEPPDIYYIILDGHARQDILKEVYDYDNSSFLAALEHKGFYVAEASTSNYPQTYQSLASSLNLKYINYLTDIFGANAENRGPLHELIDNNEVYAFLEGKGYIFVTFASGWSGVDGLSSPDVFMRGKMNIQEFENVLIETTPLAFFLAQDVQYVLHRNKILYTLDHLADVADIEAPTFTLAHIVAPHPPFVFNEQGGEVEHDMPFSTNDSTWKAREGRSPEEYVQLYKAQVSYIDEKVLEAVDEVLARSPNPPLIILQSDHGPAAYFQWNDPSAEAIRERMSILNAYYFPGDKKIDSLYDTITPVNSFRVVFNEYFGQSYPLLEDKNYFASWWTPYRFEDVTELVQTRE